MVCGCRQGAAAAPVNHPVRNHQAPVRYREGVAKQGKGEYIDPTPSDDTCLESSSDDGKNSHHPSNHTFATVDTTVSDPSAMKHSTKGGKVAYDICHFFHKDKDQMICLLCK